MRVRGLVGGVAALLIVGENNGQSQTTLSTVPAALAQPRPSVDQPIVLMRTAGQPDRQLKVLKQSRFSDGESIAELQDVASGQVFTLPGKVVALLPRMAGSAAPTQSPVAVAPPIRQASPEPTMPLQPAKSAARLKDDQPMPKVMFIPAPPVEAIPILVADAKFPPALPIPVPGASLVWRPRSDTTPPLAPTPVGKPDRWQPNKRMNPSSLQSLAAPARDTLQSDHGEDSVKPPAPPSIRPRVVEERGELIP